MRVALIENFGADFVGARLRYALFLKEQGVDVEAVIPKDGHKSIIESHGIKVFEVGENIRAKGIGTKLKYASDLRKRIKKGNYDVVHFYRLQPNIIGTIVSGLSVKSKIVNHITGLGIAFSKNDFKSKLQKLIIKTLYKVNHFLFKPYYVFQNEEDASDLGISSRMICIKGSAVNESKFNPENVDNTKINGLREEFSVNENENSKTFLFVSRIIKEKGVLELIEGFKEANKEHNDIHKLLIVGWSDNENPSAISKEMLEKHIDNNLSIHYLGKRSDVEVLITMSDVSILPTYYREGTPRFLLESMVMKNPIITTRMPGCSHLVNQKNGILINPKSSLQIKEAILSILEGDLKEMGEESSKLYFEKFSEKIVYSEIHNLYLKLLK